MHVVDARGLGKGLVLVEQVDLMGGYQVWRSDSFVGGWTTVAAGTAPCGHSDDQIDMCRTYAAHVELSTAETLLMSYFDPAQSHVGVVAVPW